MCTHHYCRNSLHCIIPPYMMAKLISQTDATHSLLATNIGGLALDDEIRGRRQTFSKLNNEHKLVLAGLLFEKNTLGNAPVSTAIIAAQGNTATLNRLVYDAGHAETLPGNLVRSEGDPPVGDADLDNVYDNAGAVWDFYNSQFGRNSIDNQGMAIIQTAHFGSGYQNAFWDGKQMIYGDGDGNIFDSFALDIDIAGHEMTHGVVQYECNLDYINQSGALNESLADIFGIMIKQKVLNQDVIESNWLIGENTLRGDNYAIRSLKAPGTAYINHPDLGDDPQPAHMSNYFQGRFDNGGVHLNSGIPNHAFYLAAFNIGGYAWDKAGQIWYNAMCNKTLVPTNATFADFKNATIEESSKLYGSNSTTTLAVVNAWNSVGV